MATATAKDVARKLANMAQGHVSNLLIELDAIKAAPALKVVVLEEMAARAMQEAANIRLTARPPDEHDAARGR